MITGDRRMQGVLRYAAALDREPQVCARCFNTARIFQHLAGRNAQETSPYIWTLSERCCIYFMSRAPFNRQNPHISIPPGDLRPVGCHGQGWIPVLKWERLIYYLAKRQFVGAIWYGITIEHVLMCTVKVTGGLTRGHGFIDNTLVKWACVLTLCTPICTTVEEFTGSHTESSGQHCEVSDHNDLRPTQQARDQVNLGPFIQWHKARPPFSGRYGGDLLSLSPGITDDSTVYCHNTEEVGLWL